MQDEEVVPDTSSENVLLWTSVAECLCWFHNLDVMNWFTINCLLLR